jgi:glycine hydroxymethyltransferase
MGTPDMKAIASLIARAIATDDEKVLAGIRGEVHQLTARFPIYSA